MHSGHFWLYCEELHRQGPNTVCLQQTTWRTEQATIVGDSIAYYRTRSNFRGLKLLQISQIRGYHVLIFAGPHPVPLFFLFKLTSDRPE